MVEIVSYIKINKNCMGKDVIQKVNRHTVDLSKENL